MISILTSLNDKISSLTRKMKARGLLHENEENDRAGDRMEEDMTMDITFINLDQTSQKQQEHMAKEIQKTYEAVEMMHELERKIEE